MSPPPSLPGPSLPGPSLPGPSLTGLRSRAVRAWADPLARGSLAIMATTVVTSLLGYLFWLIVARRFGVAVSGSAAGATSALQATVLVASVGSAAALVEWLPRSRTSLEWRQRVTAGLALAVVTALIGGPLVVLVLGRASSVLPLLNRPGAAVSFCLAAVVFAAGTVLDYVAISERRSLTLILRSLVMSGLRLPLLFLPAAVISGVGGPSGGVLTAWFAAGLVSLAVAVLGFTRAADGRTLAPEFGALGEHLREMASSFLGQHLITVAASLAGYLLPVLVVARLSAADNGYFYITWMLGSIFSIISPAVSTALFAEGAATPAALPALVRRCALLIGALLSVPILIYLIAGGWLLDLFGADYAEHGRLLLIVLTAAAIPDAITNIAVAVLRATGRLAEAIVLNASMLVACLAGSWLLLPRLGIDAVGYCWLGSQLLGVVYIVLARHRIFAGAATTGRRGTSRS